MKIIILFLLLITIQARHPLLKKELTKQPILQYKEKSEENIRNNINEEDPKREKNIKHFNGTIVGYITPWNLHGMIMMEDYKEKLDILSPVLYTIENTNGKNIISGTDELNIIGYPRYTFSSVKGNLKEVGKMIKKHCKQQKEKCKGIMIDGIFTLYNEYQQQMGKQLQMMLEELKELKIIMAIPPLSIFTKREVEMTKKYIQMYIIMTYDYVFRGSVFNSPLYFIDKAMKYIDAKGPQFAIGINFYGYATCKNKQPIVIDRKNYFDWLEATNESFTWNEKEHSHTFIVDDCVVDYPTILSLYQRIRYASKYNYSIGIWELGQGLDYFLDIF